MIAKLLDGNFRLGEKLVKVTRPSSNFDYERVELRTSTTS